MTPHDATAPPARMGASDQGRKPASATPARGKLGLALDLTIAQADLQNLDWAIAGMQGYIYRLAIERVGLLPDLDKYRVIHAAALANVERISAQLEAAQ